MSTEDVSQIASPFMQEIILDCLKRDGYVPQFTNTYEFFERVGSPVISKRPSSSELTDVCKMIIYHKNRKRTSKVINGLTIIVRSHNKKTSKYGRGSKCIVVLDDNGVFRPVLDPNGRSVRASIDTPEA